MRVAVGVAVDDEVVEDESTEAVVDDESAEVVTDPDDALWRSTRPLAW
jgi:hypothetical protein